MANALFISVHDFRSLRKASVHFIAAEMAKQGKTRFFSVGLSKLSEHRGDTRSSLSHRANRIEIVDNVECYLWRLLWHPFAVRWKQLTLLEAAMFRTYRSLIPRVARQWVEEADIVFVESGLGVVFIADVRRLNPDARIVYLASDDLDVIRCANTIKEDFFRNFDLIDTVRLPSRFLLSGMPHSETSVIVPHGIDKAIAETKYPNPYGGRRACISVGSMLFDANFFEIASNLFPQIDFYIIGAGKAASGLQAKNIHVLQEMAFLDTLPYLQHAAFGVAPYKNANTPRYLLDTSLKLRQFELFGIPAVCPHFALGDTPSRFGYEPSDTNSIRSAIDNAMNYKNQILVNALGWHDVVERILHPAAYAEVRI